MATKPENVTFRASNVDILKALSPHMPYDWQNRIPEITQENMAKIANPTLEFEGNRNSFISSLMNRIGLVLVTSKMFYNDLAEFKRGTLDYGETVEEVFVNIAKAHPFDAEKAEKEVFKRELPDVQTAFHSLNSKLFYKTTISNEELRTAFLSEYGLSDLVQRIVESLSNGAEYDDFLNMKHVLIDGYNKGALYPIHIPEVNEANSSDIARIIKSASNSLTRMSNKYNFMGVLNHTPKRDQLLIMDSDFDAFMDVDVLASAFNMDKVEFMGRRVMIDDFGELTGVHAMLVDRDFFMCFNNWRGFTENYNGEGLYWNYWLHVWNTYSRSPFANAIVFTTDTVSVNVQATVEPTTLNFTEGGTAKITANVTSTGGASKEVYYSLGEGTTGVTIDGAGNITVSPNATAGENGIEVTVTSVYDPTVSATVKVTNSGN